MGVIEAQVRYVITRRMKHLGGGWTRSGTDHMAHLLAARANDELQRYIPERDWDRDRLDEVLGEKPVNSSSQVYAEDMEEWLRTSMPTLTGPHADRPWVKHVLREVSKVAPKFGVA